VGGILHIGEVLEVARVGEQVEVGDLPLRPLAQQEPYEVRADETGAAGDEYCRNLTSSGGRGGSVQRFTSVISCSASSRGRTSASRVRQSGIGPMTASVFDRS